jgi:hypothetical protein
MKKILLALAILASLQVANAQVKNAADAQKAVEAAEKTAQDAKKATKVGTWMNLGKAYMDAYNVPAGNVWQGASKTELALAMGNDKPKSTETVTLAGEQYEKDVYATKNLYFTPKGQLKIIEITQPVYKNALEKAEAAYRQAAQVDSKGSKDKDIKAAMEMINQKYIEEAYNQYTFGNLKGASEAFETASKVMEGAPLNKIDTSSIYNAGFTAWAAADYARAKGFFETCLKNGYYGQDGECYAKLADVMDKTGDKANSKTFLEEGFAKFPQSQSILIGLINYYVSNNENPDKLYSLLDAAKKNEPDNASLYYVEGNIRLKLGDEAGAITAYEKCAQVNPAYEFGYIGEGQMFYNKALDLQDKAQSELDDTKYQALVDQFNASLKNSIAPFEKAYSISKDNSIKVSVAEYLKNAYFRFRSESADNQAAYDKYSKVVSTGTPE